MADSSVPPSNATGHQSIDSEPSPTGNGPSPSPLGNEASQLLEQLFPAVAPETQAHLTATHAGATGLTREEMQRFIKVCDYDRDAHDIVARAVRR